MKLVRRARSLTATHGRVPRCSCPTVGSSSTRTTVARSTITRTPRPSLALDPAHRPARTFIDQSLVARGKACPPVAEAGLGELSSLRVRGRERAEEPLTSSTNELVLDSFRDETAAVPLEPVDARDEVGRPPVASISTNHGDPALSPGTGCPARSPRRGGRRAARRTDRSWSCAAARRAPGRSSTAACSRARARA